MLSGSTNSRSSQQQPCQAQAARPSRPASRASASSRLGTKQLRGFRAVQPQRGQLEASCSPSVRLAGSSACAGRQLLARQVVLLHRVQCHLLLQQGRSQRQPAAGQHQRQEQLASPKRAGARGGVLQSMMLQLVPHRSAAHSASQP